METMPAADAEFAAVVMLLLVGFVVVLSLVAVGIQLLIVCKIFAKAGYSWAIGLLVLVPIANIVIWFYLAFADWPVLRQLRQLKLQPAPTGQGRT